MENNNTQSGRGGSGKCGGCGETFSVSFKFCPYCGASAAVVKPEESRPVASTASQVPDPAEMPAKVLSPEAKKALEEFDMKFDLLLQSRKNKMTGTKAEMSPRTKTLYMLIIGGTILIIVIVILFMMRSMSQIPAQQF